MLTYTLTETQTIEGIDAEPVENPRVFSFEIDLDYDDLGVIRQCVINELLRAGEPHEAIEDVEFSRDGDIPANSILVTTSDQPYTRGIEWILLREPEFRFDD